MHEQFFLVWFHCWEEKKGWESVLDGILFTAGYTGNAGGSQAAARGVMSH